MLYYNSHNLYELTLIYEFSFIETIHTCSTHEKEILPDPCAHIFSDLWMNVYGKLSWLGETLSLDQCMIYLSNVKDIFKTKQRARYHNHWCTLDQQIFFLIFFLALIFREVSTFKGPDNMKGKGGCGNDIYLSSSLFRISKQLYRFFKDEKTNC